MSRSSTLISNVRLLCPGTNTDQISHVRFEAGQITHVGEAVDANIHIDGTGLWLMPGIVDLCARLREPGATQKASIASESRAALAAGITLLVMPPDTRPVADTQAVIDRIHAKGLEANAASVRVLGALSQGLTGDSLAELSALKAAGVLGVSNGLKPMANLLVARRALEYADGLGLTVHVVAMEASLANGGCAHEGAVATRLGLPPIPVAAEVAALRSWISLVEDTGAHLHVGRLSSQRAVHLIAASKTRGLPITADVAAHQLFLTDSALEGFNAMAHVIPPLRSEQDRQALREGLASGVIDAVCSDHAPHELDAKVNPFPLTEAGISGLETLLPLCLRLVHEGVLSPMTMVERLSIAPAAILRLPPPVVRPGATARLTLIDPTMPWLLLPAEMRSRGHNTPFAGTQFAGICRNAFV